MTFTALSAELLNPWVIFGFFGQFIFFLRFIIQWLTSEKKQAVIVPLSFWYLSIGGSLLILVYSIHIRDIVFATAQVLSLFIYFRNLMLQNNFAAQSSEATEASVNKLPS
ncbi:lipid-A-disaccharide synthase N-terminal domain-containing protein [Patescibacteria group bacterium]|nr:lipid-A-disaccharide synthase N-terminal domain-containing protein [Patescibacteria group bacterium]